ncbi:MAG: hypothetical protein IIB12_08615 [Chloroflexi bacterium]|nr:hypothetical protein [Chloroflexota bacterium]
MLVVGGEAFDTGVRLEWFRRSDLYAKDQFMRPFDADSSGFYVGEGAGAMVLESQTHAQARGANIYATYEGGGFAQQAWKQVIPDVRAGRLTGAITRALDSAKLTAGDLDLTLLMRDPGVIKDLEACELMTQGASSDETVTVKIATDPTDFQPTSGDYETLAGFLLAKLGHVPHEGEQVRYNGLRLVVSEMKGVKIERILVTRW